MKTAYQGMNVRGAELDALVENRLQSLDQFEVLAKEKGELLGALDPMKPAIVGH
jgi:hemoglobin